MGMLEHRIARLERSIRNQRRVTFGLLVTAVGALAMGARQETKPDIPEVLRARRFEAVAQNGTVVVEISTQRPPPLDPEELKALREAFKYDPKLAARIDEPLPESGALTIRSDKGVVLSSLRGFSILGKPAGRLEVNGPLGHPLFRVDSGCVNANSINVGRDSDKPQVQIGEAPEGGTVSINSKNGNSVVRLSADEQGDGRVLAGNRDGKIVAALAAGESSGQLLLIDSGSKSNVDIGFTVNGGDISIVNKTGERVVTLVADDYGNGGVGVWNRKGKGRTLTPGP